MERIICIQLDFNIDMPVEKSFYSIRKLLHICVTTSLWKITSCEFPGHTTKWDTLTYVFPVCLTRWELFTKTNKQDNKSILLPFSSLSTCTSSRVSLSKDGTYTRSKIDQLLCCWPPRHSKNLWKCQKQHQFIFGIGWEENAMITLVLPLQSTLHYFGMVRIQLRMVKGKLL